jgi:hypothetical protein
MIFHVTLEKDKELSLATPRALIRNAGPGVDEFLKLR